MRRRKKIGKLLYLLNDFISALLAWVGVFLFRRIYIQGYHWQDDLHLDDPNLWLGSALVPLFWLLLYFVIGAYGDIYRKSRLTELYTTFQTTLFGTVILFFGLILDDVTADDYRNYYRTFGLLFGLQFVLTFTGRWMILNAAKAQIEKGVAGYNTLIVGANNKAIKLYQDITNRRSALGYKFRGFITINGDADNGLQQHLPKLGTLADIKQIIADNDIEEVIIAIETEEHGKIQAIMNSLATQDVVIKIIPGIYDILAGSVKMTHVVGAMLIEIHPQLMPLWQRIIKRGIDIAVSATLLLLLSPLLAFAAVMVKLTSKGPVLYSQERIGKRGKPYHIHKFRSMYVNAEQDGPQLSSDRDKRITRWGWVMRKWRIDELPQFWNVLKGEMSLVGPRPEREYFIDKIVERAPEYLHLQKVKPGITSWGMVKFGYAENVDEMIERMQFDLLYIENMSLALDFKIMIYTLLTVIKGEGK